MTDGGVCSTHFAHRVSTSVCTLVFVSSSLPSRRSALCLAIAYVRCGSAPRPRTLGGVPGATPKRVPCGGHTARGPRPVSLPCRMRPRQTSSSLSRTSKVSSSSRSQTSGWKRSRKMWNRSLTVENFASNATPLARFSFPLLSGLKHRA